LKVLDRGLGAHHEATSARAVGLENPRPPIDDAARWESQAPARISELPPVARWDLFTSVMVASMISVRLCGGMFVAMPTAIPFDPFTSRLGMREGEHVRLELRCRHSSGRKVDGFLVQILK